MRKLILGAALALCAGATASAATTTAPAATGLPGTTWAVNCAAPASATNFYLFYTLDADGNLTEVLRSTWNEERQVRNIQSISSDWLLYTLTNKAGQPVNILTFMGKDGRKKSWWSVGGDGTPYIADGRYPEAGEPPWFTRCR